ncbi:NAD-dependent epimerase/dehydratase family protein [Saccharobesus litoralis]|uniref:NAD-dependent epimerase/dehydratase family protein n=1 Tax=Saccharobesus litoralis TaxID=2172099 RepID=UPI00190252FB|nr:NAD-dependent epimerase/dehydratase family protein [Saccharobesus litoralis]
MSFVNQKVLVVGGAGFVGSNLCKLLLKDYEPAEVLVIDNLLSAESCNVPIDDRVNFICGSISDDKVLDKIPDDINYVFHLACYHGNQSSIEDPLADHENNTLTSLKLFNRLYRYSGIKKVVYAAAGCAVAEKTYDTASATAEDAPVSLFHDSPYSISKLIGEMYGNYFFKLHKLPFVKARFQNVYGPGEILGAGLWRGTRHTVWRNVTPTFIWKSLHNEALPLDNGGIATRDFIYVEDMARGLIACALKGDPGETYNLATGVETSIWDLANTINSYTGNEAGISVEKPRDWDNSGKRFGTTEKSEAQLGFRAQVSIQDGIKATVEWTRNNQEKIASTMEKHVHFLPEVTKYL